MQSLQILDYITGAVKYTVPVTDSCTRQAEIMGEDSITLKFNFASEISLVVGDYIQYTEFGIVKNFYLRDYKDKSSYYDKNGNVYSYTITFVSALNMLSNIALFRQIEYENQFISEYEFSLTDRLDKHAECLLQCIKNAFAEWGTYGRLTTKYMEELCSYELPDQDYSETEQKTIEYSGISIYDGLSLLAQEFETEFWVEKRANANILHLDKCENYPTQNVLSLSNTYNDDLTSNGLASIKYEDKEDNIGAIIPLGSDRNITRKEATFQGVDCSFDGRLRLIPNYTYTINNKEYTTTQGGGLRLLQDSEIDTHAKSGYQRQVVEFFEDIYPHLYFKVVFTDWLTNSNYDKEISQLTIAQCDSEGNLLDNTENKIQNLECNDGDEMMLQFESGRLRGSEFSVSYNSQTGKGTITRMTQSGNYTYNPAFTITILPQQDNDKVLLPTRQIPPKNGDIIGIYGIKVSELDLAEARQKLAESAIKKIEDLSNSMAEISCVTEPKYVYDNGTVIQLGTNFVETERLSDIGTRRISQFSHSLTNPYAISFRATSSIIEGRLASIEDIIAETNKDLQTAKRKVNSISSNAISTFSQMNELSNMLNSLKAEMLLVGCAKWQYTTDVTFSVNGKNLEIVGGVITHSQAPYKFYSYQYNGSLKVGEFIMPNFSTDNLQLDDDKSYYLYAKLEEVTDKTQDYQYLWELTDVRKSDEINTDPEYVLFGILSSVFENTRTFNQVNGFTSVVGGKITTEVLKDKDNNLIIDFVNKRIIAQNGATIVGNIEFLDSQGNTIFDSTSVAGGTVLTNDILIKKNGVVIGGLSGNGRNEVNPNTQVVEGKSYFWLGSENPSIWESPICFGEIDTSLFNYIPEKGLSVQVMYSILTNGFYSGMLYVGQYANTNPNKTPIQTRNMVGTFLGNSLRRDSNGDLATTDIVQGINFINNNGQNEISIGRHLGSHGGANTVSAVFKNAHIYLDGTSRIIGNEKIYATYPPSSTFTNDLKARMYHEILFEEGKSTTIGLYLPSTMDDTDSVEFQHIHIYTRNIGSGNYVTIYAPTSGLYQYMYMYANGTQTTKNGVKIYLDSHVHLMVRKGSNNNLIYYLIDYSNGVTLL